MSFSRVGLGLFKGVGGGVTGLMGAGLVNFLAPYISFLSPISIKETAFILALGNFLYGLAVSDANGKDQMRKAMGVDDYGTSIVKANGTRIGRALFYADEGNMEKALDSIKGGEIREKFFIQDFLASMFENFTAGTIGFGVLMWLNPVSISMTYMQLMSGVTTGTFVASSARSLMY